MTSVLFSLALAQTTALGVDGLYRLDRLPVLTPALKIGAVTSYDRTEGNDDGFSGKYSFVRKEGDALVLADLKGPGCITRIHTPTPTDDPIEFYFDGETKPRVALPFRKLFTGDVPPFVRPVVDAVGGGCYSYVPMPYARSCKVVLRGPAQFYDLNFATYPAGTAVRTYDPKDVDSPSLARAKAVWEGGRESDQTAFNVPSGTKLTRRGFDAVLLPGKATTLFETRQGGRIASLRLGPSDAFAGKERDVLLRITWEGAKSPAVLMPVGDFFGYAWGKPAMASALVGSWNGVNYCNLPLPFDRAAKIELVSKRNRPISVRGEVVVGNVPRRKDEGRFYAVWQRESPTVDGKPFTWLDMKGQGKLIGLSLQSQGAQVGIPLFFEGDDITTIDGERVVHGTGSEDFFNGGWYDVPGRWDETFSRALSGCLTYQKHLGRTGGYRFFLNDAYPFNKSIVQTIEHGPERNATLADYCGVAYLYADRAPQNPMSGLQPVVDPPRIVYEAHWAMPIDAFSLSGTTLTRGEVPVGDRRVRALSLRAKGEGEFGLLFVALRATLPQGRYKVFADVVKGPEAGRLRLFQGETSLGEAIDLYAEKPVEAKGLYLGDLAAAEGENKLIFRILGKNPAATGMGLDLVNVIFVKA